MALDYPIFPLLS